MQKSTDTIAAIATAAGRGGIGVVRVSGPKVPAIMEAMLGRLLLPRQASLTDFRDAKGATLDQGIALFFPGPNSFTGEDILELQGHGGPAVLQMILGACLGLGARLAEPGEFTLRAYLNDKLDLAQAESVADLIDASSAEAARSALRSLQGEFSRAVRSLVTGLVELRMLAEATLDFPEEDVDFLEAGNALSQLDALARELAALTNRAQQGRLLRDGLHVVLMGQPNVGKSSLLNQLAGDEVAIVTAVPGTTRDVIRHAVEIEGIPLHIVDTAGLRETADIVEREGIARTWREIERADLGLWLTDAGNPEDPAHEPLLGRLPEALPLVTVYNKIDLAGGLAKKGQGDRGPLVWLSAKTGEGIPLLQEVLLQLAGWHATGEGVFTARARHLEALSEAGGYLRQARGCLRAPELFAEELRGAQESLNRITGEFTPDDLLGEIFSRFCIGK